MLQPVKGPPSSDAIQQCTQKKATAEVGLVTGCNM